MGIQERLKKQRYGRYNYKVDNKYNLKEYKVTRAEQYLLRKHNTYQKIFNIITRPAQGRYKEGYDNLINDYTSIYKCKSNSFTAITHIMIQRLKSFISTPQLYANSFIEYSVAWYVSTLFQMRKSILYRLSNERKIPKLRNYNLPSTNGYYPLVKPMETKYTIQRALQIYDILIDVLSLD